MFLQNPEYQTIPMQPSMILAEHSSSCLRQQLDRGIDQKLDSMIDAYIDEQKPASETSQSLDYTSDPKYHL